jgi:hypothetical protein
MIFRNISRIFPAALCCVLLFSGCVVNVDDADKPNVPPSGTDANGVDWKNYGRADTYSIRVNNDSNFDLVAFKTKLSATTILGGVPQGKRDHGFKLDTTLFPAGSSDAFSIVFLTKDDYEKFKNDLSSREGYPFTRIFAAYNASGTNDTPWEVSGRLGGDNQLIINNQTKWNMELRENSPRGTTLGYAPYEANQTILHMHNGSFYVFPVFKQYIAARDEIITIYPRTDQGIPMGDSFSFENGKPITINANKYIANTNMSSGAAYLVVHNGSEQGISVFNGSEEKATATGITAINSGDTRSFEILMDGSASSGYGTSKSIAGWKIVYLGTLEKPIPTASLEADHRYYVEVTGDWFHGVESVTVSTPEKGEKVEIEVGDV